MFHKNVHIESSFHQDLQNSKTKNLKKSIFEILNIQLLHTKGRRRDNWQKKQVLERKIAQHRNSIL
jgi:hypothetical protein